MGCIWLPALAGVSSLHALYSCWLKLPAADTCDYPAAAWLGDAICTLVICGQITLITFFLVSSGSDSPLSPWSPLRLIHFSSAKDVINKGLLDVADLHCVWFGTSAPADQAVLSHGGLFVWSRGSVLRLSEHLSCDQWASRENPDFFHLSGSPS